MPPTKVLISKPLKQTKKTRATQTFREKEVFGDKEVRRMGKKQNGVNRKNDRTRRTREEIIQKSGIKTDSPEIPDRAGGTPEMPRPPVCRIIRETCNCVDVKCVSECVRST